MAQIQTAGKPLGSEMALAPAPWEGFVYTQNLVDLTIFHSLALSFSCEVGKRGQSSSTHQSGPQDH